MTTIEPPALSLAAVSLMRGVVYRDTNEPAWHSVLRQQPHLRDHMDVLGLDVIVDEAEGYAYLRAKPEDPDAPLPRLVPRHKLSFHTSLVLALLRKALAEFDATDGQGRLVLSRDALVESVRTFLPDSSNEARLVDQVDRALGKVVDLGFLRPVPGPPAAFEVRRIVKAFVDGQWLGEFDARLREYAAQVAPGGGEEVG